MTLFIDCRRSFIYSVVEDPKMNAINASFTELQKLVHLLFIAGEDLELTERDKLIVEGKHRQGDQKSL
jgi:hypothetical protein